MIFMIDNIKDIIDRFQNKNLIIIYLIKKHYSIGIINQ